MGDYDDQWLDFLVQSEMSLYLHSSESKVHSRETMEAVESGDEVDSTFGVRYPQSGEADIGASGL